VIHAYGILYLVESSLKLRSDVKLGEGEERGIRQLPPPLAGVQELRFAFKTC
jgi:hypothetical protein